MREELLFCGIRRSEALSRLRRAYDDVAAQAQAQAKSPPSGESSLRVVLVEAEAGLGKTRLVMELYRCLKNDVDRQNYWSPNTSPSNTASPQTNKPPFIWWEMRISGEANPGNTILSKLEDLGPHLHAAGLKSSNGLTKELQAAAANVGMVLIEEMSYLGAVKRIGESFYNIFSILTQHRKNEYAGSNKDQTNRIGKTVKDMVMNHLNEVFNPKSTTFSRIPLIVFIDDAHFADKDQSIVDFIDELIARGKREQWPIMLIMTHWSHALTSRRDSRDETLSPSVVAQFLECARGVKCSDKRKSSGLLKDDDDILIRIDLSDPVDGLDMALLGQFSGLKADQVEAIIQKVGGNPRKLEEIIAMMRGRPVWFEDNDMLKPLNETGYEAVLELSGLEVERVAAERFNDTPSEVRRSMIVASVMGQTFVIDLCKRLLEKIGFSEDARSSLEIAESTYRFLRDIVDRQRNDIGEFAQPLFFDMVCTHRANRLPEHFWNDWLGDDRLEKSLDELLVDVVCNPGEFRNYTLDDMAEVLLLAARRMEKVESRLGDLALARLVAVQNRRGNLEGAYDAATRFIAGLKKTTWDIGEIPVDLADEVADTLLRLGQTKDAELIWVALHQGLEDQVSAESVNMGRQHDLAVSHERLGSFYLLDGNTEAALERFHAALEIAERISALDPENSEWQYAISAFHDRLGDVHLVQGKSDTALERFRNSLDIRERLARLEPANSRWLRALSHSYDRLGDQCVTRGKISDALNHYGASRETRERLVKEEEAVTEWKRELAISHERLGDLHLFLGNTEEAKTHFNAAFEISKTLAERDPANTQWKRDLALDYQRLGDVHRQLEDLETAWRCYRDARWIMEQLSSVDPDRSEWLRDLSNIHERVGLLHVVQGGGDEAIASFQTSLEIRKDLAKSDPRNSQWQRDLAVSCNHLGDLYMFGGESDAAFRCYSGARTTMESLVKGDSANVLWQEDLLTIFGRLGDLLKAREEDDQALESYRAALAISKWMAEKDPTNLEWQRNLARGYSQLADMHWHRNQNGDAFEGYTAALIIRRDLFDREPSNSEWARDLALSYNRVGNLFLAEKNIDAALNAYRSALHLIEGVVKAKPTNVRWQWDLSVISGRLGDLYRVHEGIGDPLPFYQSAYSIAARLAGADLKNTEFQYGHMVRCNQLGELYADRGDDRVADDYFREGIAIAKRLAEMESKNVEP